METLIDALAVAIAGAIIGSAVTIFAIGMWSVIF